MKENTVHFIVDFTGPLKGREIEICAYMTGQVNTRSNQKSHDMAKRFLKKYRKPLQELKYYHDGPFSKEGNSIIISFESEPSEHTIAIMRAQAERYVFSNKKLGLEIVGYRVM